MRTGLQGQRKAELFGALQRPLRRRMRSARSDAELRTMQAYAMGSRARHELDRDANSIWCWGWFVGPRLGRENHCFSLRLPASQAALASSQDQQARVTARFELGPWTFLELANGFHELVQPRGRQAQRCTQDLALGRARGRSSHRGTRICCRPREWKQRLRRCGAGLTGWGRDRMGARIDWPPRCHSHR